MAKYAVLCVLNLHLLWNILLGKMATDSLCKNMWQMLIWEFFSIWSRLSSGESCSSLTPWLQLRCSPCWRGLNPHKWHSFPALPCCTLQNPVDMVHAPKDCYKEQRAPLTGILNAHWLQTYLGILPLVKGYEYFLIQMDSRTSWTLAKPLAS